MNWQSFSSKNEDRTIIGTSSAERLWLHLMVERQSQSPRVQKDKTGRFVNLFIIMGDVHGSVDFDVASDLVCYMYAQSKTKDVDEARYNRLIQVSGKVDQIGCKILYSLTRYFRMTNYMWMFCEGYYLHKLIVACFAEQNSLLPLYIFGWGCPLLAVLIYSGVRVFRFDTQ
ncbi:Calcitonin receptor [Nymphon striatum]|nr:Calcitonin receptor [Nymphon striatum]